MITIVGCGFVGSALIALCDKTNTPYNACDISGKFKYTNIQSLPQNSINYVFVCVPTPSADDGSCNVTIVKRVVSEIVQHFNNETIIIIRSTLVPGTCAQLQLLCAPHVQLVFCPEFLREKFAIHDTLHAEFVLVGHALCATNYKKIQTLWQMLYAYKNITIIAKSHIECELFKYTVNTYLATKITFFNEIHTLCSALHVNYERVRDMFALDARIGDYGITVPGHHGFGYSGACLPKEVRGMIALQNDQHLCSDFFTTVNAVNNAHVSRPQFGPNTGRPPK